MTADIPSWMTQGNRRVGLGEIDPKKPKDAREVLLVEETELDAPYLEIASEVSDPEAEAAQDVSAPTERDAPSATAPDETDAFSQEALAVVLPKLKGVRSVTIRIYGPNAEAGPALQNLLQRRGIGVKISSITQIVPAPLSKFSVRYQGADATLTVAPDLDL
ncbi:hypothetical protein [Albirhodobacter sp. R86504]|uniref:hypothetical protein n=1 Tax=Albirhodobacter sp. R86504 TaxID=3093848 RepID=UPI00366C5A51